MPPGSAVYARGEFDESMIKETMFLIREEPLIVQRFPAGVQVELRTGLFADQGVMLVAVIFRIEGEYYETWWNYHQTGGVGPQHFSDMTTQARIPILFFTPEMARSIAIQNSLAPFFDDAAKRIQRMPAWSMQDFEAARERVYARFPTVTKLWNALRRIK